jgi:hypothetical protein
MYAVAITAKENHTPSMFGFIFFWIFSFSWWSVAV